MIDMDDFANKIIKMLQLPEEFKEDHKHWPVVRHTDKVFNVSFASKC